MNIRKISCPPDCPDRTAECHATCRRYALRQAAQKVINKKKKAEADATAMWQVRYQKSSNERFGGIIRKSRRQLKGTEDRRK